RVRRRRGASQRGPSKSQGLSDGSRRWLFYAGLTQETSSFFGRGRIDVETGAPLKSCRLGQLGHELNVPVIVIIGRILDWRSMYDQVVRWIVEHSIGLGEQNLQRLGKVFKHVLGRVLKGRFMTSRQDPGLERESRRIRSRNVQSTSSIRLGGSVARLAL